MKTLIGIIAGVILFLLIASNLGGCENDGVSRQEFENAHNYLNNRVDTVIDNQEVLKTNQIEMQNQIALILEQLDQLEENQDNMAYQLDTLKAGQILIYNEVTSFNSQQETKDNWAGSLINWLQ